jgi:hypothetical protein
MQVVRSSQSLDGGDFGALRHLTHRDQASPSGFPVHDDSACSALPIAAADLAARQQQFFAQNAGEALRRIDDQRAIQAVNIENSLFHGSLLLPFFVTLIARSWPLN